jgi:hypothetical protein
VMPRTGPILSLRVFSAFFRIRYDYYQSRPWFLVLVWLVLPICSIPVGLIVPRLG